MAPQSIRVRLTLWYSLALAGALLLFALALWLSMWRSLHRELLHTLDERVASIDSFLREELNDPTVDLRRELDEYSRGFPSGTLVDLAAPGHAAYSSDRAFPWPRTQMWPQGVRQMRWHGQEFQVVVHNVTIVNETWRITFAVSLGNVQHTLNRLAWLLVALAPLVVLIAPLAGWWLSRRALKPVDRITAAARDIGIQNLSERLPVQHTGDELERLALTWNSMLSRLEDAVLRLTRFTSAASHELRTPLAVIRTTAEIAVRKPRTADAYRDALEQIIKESDRMTVLIEDLLLLARCDAASLDLPKERLVLGQIVGDVCTVMRPLAELGGVALIADEENSCRTVGNAQALRRLLLILVDNAIKYCRPGGIVNVSVTREGSDDVRLAVRDTGEGIPPEELDLVFQRFYRGEGARRQGVAGFGLGLALAHGIAELHGSKIEVRSAVGRGSTFAVVFASV